MSAAYKNPFAVVAEVLLLTQGYLDDGFGESDLRERLAHARPALDALRATVERQREALEEIRERWAYPKLVALIDEVLGEAAE